MTSKYVPPPMKPVTKISETVKSSAITKLLPFICAGTAIGVSILALKELKKVKSELVVVKTQQPIAAKPDPTISKKMEQLEEQMKRMNEYLLKNNSKNPKIIKNVVTTEIPKEVKIINEPENVEYEEIEVTDDESEEEM